MKNIALCLFSILVGILVASFLFNKNVSDTATNETQSYYEEQQKAYMAQMAKANEQAQRMDQLLERNEKNQDRYEALLTRWEKQADQMDKFQERLSSN